MLTPSDLENFASKIADLVVQRLADQPALLDRVALAKKIGLSVPTIDRMVRDGQIPAIKGRSRVLFDLKAVKAALAS